MRVLARVCACVGDSMWVHMFGCVYGASVYVCFFGACVAGCECVCVCGFAWVHVCVCVLVFVCWRVWARV